MAFSLSNTGQLVKVCNVILVCFCDFADKNISLPYGRKCSCLPKMKRKIALHLAIETPCPIITVNDLVQRHTPTATAY